MEIDTIYNMDCLEGMKQIPDGTIDAVICDLPYGTTANKWDSVIPLDKLWAEYRRIIKSGGAIVLFGAEPFTSFLRMSNIDWYRYNLIWRRSRRQPDECHSATISRVTSCYQDIAVFSDCPAVWIVELICEGTIRS